MIDNWALIYVEEKEPWWDSGGGEWFNERRWNYLWNCDDCIIICDMEQQVQEALEKYDFFYVLLCDVSWYYEAPSCSPHYGFCVGEAGIEYSSLLILSVSEDGYISVHQPSMN